MRCLTIVPCECSLTRPRARPCTVSAAAPFTRGAGLHLTFREYIARAHLSVCRLSLKRCTQKTAWRCGAHRASQDNEATPRGRPADRTTTCQPRVEGGKGKSRATGLMSVRPIGGSLVGDVERAEGRIRARYRRRVKCGEGSAVLPSRQTARASCRRRLTDGVFYDRVAAALQGLGGRTLETPR